MPSVDNKILQDFGGVSVSEHIRRAITEYINTHVVPKSATSPKGGNK